MRDIRAFVGRLCTAACLAAALAVTQAAAQTALTPLSLSDASWTDGGTLSGHAIFDFSTITGAITKAQSADITAGSARTTYFFVDSFQIVVLNQQIINGYANELAITEATQTLVLDWQGDPSSQYVGDTTTGFFGTEYYAGLPGEGDLSNQGGMSAGNAISMLAEPATILVMASALVGLVLVRRHWGVRRSK